MNCPHEYKLRLIMTTLARHVPHTINGELIVLLLKIHKKKYNYTVTELSSRTRTPRASLSRYLKEGNIPTYTNCVNLINYLDSRN